MKRSWTTYALITGLAGLLVLLGALQYNWLKQISESDGEKTQKRVQEQADRFAADFNREIQNAYFNFQTNAESWKNQDWTSFNERLDFWRDKTLYPELIREFYFFETDPNAKALKYDGSIRAFVPTEVSAELAEIRSHLADEKNFRPVHESTYTLLLPIHNASAHDVKRILVRSRTPETVAPLTLPDKYGHLAIRLDPAAITDRILPDLTAKYFGDGEFNAAVVDKAGQGVFGSIPGETRDATAALFDLSPDNFIFYANKELMSSIGGEKREGITLNSRIETRTLSPLRSETNRQSAVKIEVKKDAVPRTTIFATATDAADRGPWMLHVQHASGSLNTHLANTLRRNLAIGFGILLLLAAAIATIVISAQRAKLLAQRQMDFVSSVSHEFRTPLAVIYSAGENLADGVAKEDGQVARYGDLIKGEGRKLTGMVEQILDFAGANSGRKKYNFTMTTVDAVVSAALDECQPLINDKGVVVEKNIAAALPSINADHAALSQAIQNLIANAIKYGNGNPWIGVTATNGSGTVKIIVEDQGLGISKTDLMQIFEPFYRSKEVVDAQINGNGLGLSLVKQIVNAHRGRVTANSQLGKGSEFTIEIPVA